MRRNLVQFAAVAALTACAAFGQGGFNGPGRYEITNLKSGKVIDLDRNDQSTVIQFSSRGTDNQAWDIQPAGTGYFYIRNGMNGYALEAAGGNGTPLRGTPFNGSASQQWRIEPGKDGNATLVNRSGKGIDVPDGTNRDGVKLQVYDLNGDSNQRFSFRPVGGSQTSYGRNDQGRYGRDAQGRYNRDGQGRYTRDDQGRYTRDDQGRYTRDDQGRYTRDDQGRYTRDDQGRYTRDDQGRYTRDDQGRYTRDDQGRYSRDDQGRYTRDDQGRYTRDDQGRYTSDDQGRYSQNRNNQDQSTGSIFGGDVSGSDRSSRYYDDRDRLWKLRGDGVCFYPQTNYRGEPYCTELGDDRATSGLGGNTFQSIKFFGRAREVEIFDSADYRGGSIRINRDQPDFRQSRSNRAGSFRVY